MDEAEWAIAERVARDAATWFPAVPAHRVVHLRPLGARRRSRLYAVSLGERAAPPLMVAKVRTAHTAVANGSGGGGRPTLSPATVDEAELTSCEYAALRHLQTAFPGDDRRFGTVPALAHLPEHHAIIMGLVPGVPMRSYLLRWSRLLPGHTGIKPEPTLTSIGAWLRHFHDATPTAERPVRQGTGRDVVAHFQALETFLLRRLGPRFGNLAGAGSALAAEVLPRGDLPLAVGHGDFAPRNVLVDPGGRVVVLDPLARWAVPAQEDLCRFLVGLQLNGLQVHTRGMAYGRNTLDAWQEALIRGYYGEAVPWHALRCYQLLILLDKWSALVEPARGGGPPAWFRRTSQHEVSRYVASEAERLLHLARSADG